MSRLKLAGLEGPSPLGISSRAHVLGIQLTDSDGNPTIVSPIDINPAKRRRSLKELARDSSLGLKVPTNEMRDVEIRMMSTAQIIESVKAKIAERKISDEHSRWRVKRPATEREKETPSENTAKPIPESQQFSIHEASAPLSAVNENSGFMLRLLGASGSSHSPRSATIDDSRSLTHSAFTDTNHHEKIDNVLSSTLVTCPVPSEDELPGPGLLDGYDADIATSIPDGVFNTKPQIDTYALNDDESVDGEHFEASPKTYTGLKRPEQCLLPFSQSKNPTPGNIRDTDCMPLAPISDGDMGEMQAIGQSLT
ncbi:hypothetical protein HDU93_000842, partial [Gonapodya sp. JEL0774]